MDNDWRRNIPPFPTPETEETPPTAQPTRFQQATQGAVDWWQRGEDARAQTSFLPRFGGSNRAQQAGAFALPALKTGGTAATALGSMASSIMPALTTVGLPIIGTAAAATLGSQYLQGLNFSQYGTLANILNRTNMSQTPQIAQTPTDYYSHSMELPIQGINTPTTTPTSTNPATQAQAQADAAQAQAQAQANAQAQAQAQAQSEAAALEAQRALAESQAEATTGGKPPDPDGDKKKEDPKDKNKFLDFLKRTYPWLITSGLLAGGLGGVGNEGSQGVGESELSSMLSQRPEGVLGEYLSRSPDEMYEDTLERTMESLRNQQVGLEESYSNLYARALQQSYRRRVATSDPFRGVTSTGGQVEQGREALSAAEINQLGQISMGFNEMLREIQNAELAAPDKALQAALQQYGISREQSEAEFLRVQRITEVLNSDNAEDVIRMNLQALGVEPEGIEELLGVRDKNKGNINWNQIATTSGIGGIIGLIIGTFVGQPMLGASIGGSVAGAGNYGWQWLQEQDWFKEWYYTRGLED